MLSAGNLESGNVSMQTLWHQYSQQHGPQQQQQQQQSSTGDSKTDHKIQVMVVQPDNEFAIGTQLSDSGQPARDFKGSSDREMAAKLVDEAAARDASQRTFTSR